MLEWKNYQNLSIGSQENYSKSSIKSLSLGQTNSDRKIISFDSYVSNSWIYAEYKLIGEYCHCQICWIDLKTSLPEEEIIYK